MHSSSAISFNFYDCYLSTRHHYDHTKPEKAFYSIARCVRKRSISFC